jgi:dTDP-glucose pyrophosphorylase
MHMPRKLKVGKCVLKECGEIRDLIVSESDSVIEAMRAIDEGAAQVGLLLDADNRLYGLITDGDIRRALLSGASLSDPVGGFVRRDFRSVGICTPRTEALDLMKVFCIKHLPIVDEKGRLAGLHLLERLIKPDALSNPALILAGGKGTRLGDLTKDVPKPMIKVAGRPILERLILHLVGSGVRQVFLSVNYLSDVIKDYFGNGQEYGCEITYLEEDEPLGTGGCLALLSSFQIEHPLIVMNGDLVTNFSVSGIVKSHLEQKNAITVGVKSYTHEIPFGCLELAGSRVCSLREKPVFETLINAGIYVIDQSQFEALDVEYRPITSLITKAVERGELVGAYAIDDWIDIGLPAELSKARREL